MTSMIPEFTSTVMILSFWTDLSGKAVQTQIRLLLEEQSDQGLHCLLFHLHVFDKITSGLASLFELKVNYSKVPCIRKFKNFTVFSQLESDRESQASNFMMLNLTIPYMKDMFSILLDT